VAAFLALGLLTDARIEELLNAKLSKARWAVVFEQGGPRGVSAPYCTSLYLSIGVRMYLAVPPYCCLPYSQPAHSHSLRFPPQQGGSWCSPINTILLDPLFSFAEWGKETVTSRYEMMEAVKVRGQALQYASYQSPSLRGDREVLLEAVKQDGDALRHAFVALKRKVKV
jgi:hypothetical protein